jgi:hypothetical protein
MASEDEDIDKLKLPAAVKLAKEKNILISGLKDLEEIKWELKKHLLAGCRPWFRVSRVIPSDLTSSFLLLVIVRSDFLKKKRRLV